MPPTDTDSSQRGGPPPLPHIPFASYPQATPSGPTEGEKWLFPVGRSGWAIAAGYAGLFSVLLIPAPIALVLGLIALTHIRRNTGLAGRGRAIFGLLAGILFSVALAFVIILIAVESARR